MARDFDGTNDRIDFGSDASIDAFTQKFGGCWMQRDVLNAEYLLFGKDRVATGFALRVHQTSAGNDMRFTHQFSGSIPSWSGPAIDTALHHLFFAYDNSSTANDPVLYVDGVAVTVTETVAPSGSASSDAALNLVAGETGNGGLDLNGALQNLTYGNGTVTAAQVNRHKWWGRIGGSVAVHHPFLTTKLTNEGTATADGSATGTAMRSLPRTERCWGSMMGVGR